jgi:ribulose-phosphate 3-epimerase
VKGLNPWIAVDGGQDEGNVALAVTAGANVIVAGSAIFGSRDYTNAIQRMRASALRSGT